MLVVRIVWYSLLMISQFLTSNRSGIIIIRGQRHLFNRVQLADRFAGRLRGLLGYGELAENAGLLLTPCRQIHTIGMRHPLDVLFLRQNGKIVKCVERLMPNRIASCRAAQHTLELRAGSIECHGLRAGHKLHWISSDSQRFHPSQSQIA